MWYKHGVGLTWRAVNVSIEVRLIVHGIQTRDLSRGDCLHSDARRAHGMRGEDDGLPRSQCVLQQSGRVAITGADNRVRLYITQLVYVLRFKISCIADRYCWYLAYCMYACLNY